LILKEIGKIIKIYESDKILKIISCFYYMFFDNQQLLMSICQSFYLSPKLITSLCSIVSIQQIYIISFQNTFFQDL